MKYKRKNKETKLTIKMIMYLTFGSMSLITTLVLSFMLYGQAMKVSINNTTTMLEESAVQASKLVGESLHSRINMGMGLQNNIAIREYNTNWDRTLTVLRENMQVYSHIDIGIIDQDGILYSQSGVIEDTSNIDYIKGALSGEAYITKPDYDDNYQKSIMTYLIPIKEEEKVIGVIYYVRDAAEINGITDRVKVLETGNCFMVDENGTMLANVNHDLVKDKFNSIEKAKTDTSFEKLALVMEDMIKGKKGHGEYYYQGENMILAYAPIGEIGWSVGLGLPYSELEAEFQDFKLYAVVISLVMLLFALIITTVSGTAVSGIVKYIVKILKSLENKEFNITVNEKMLASKTEFGIMGRSLDSLISTLGSVITEIKDMGEDIDESAASLSAFSEELSASSEDINSTITDIAKGNTVQADALKDISNTVERFKDKVDMVGTYIDVVHKNTLNIEEKASSSKDVAVIMDNATKNFNEAFNDFNSDIKSLESDMNTVENITNIINGISEQTNLLALNAAIEAARAGDAGKGFAVVAEEIRKLAEQSKNSSEEIYKIVNQSAENTKNIVSRTDVMNGELKVQSQNIDNVLAVLDEIVTSVNDVIPELQKTYTEFEELNGNSNEIRRSIEEITEISEETSASSEEISASTMELNNSSRDLADSAQNLAEQSSAIREELNKFKIKE